MHWSKRRSANPYFVARGPVRGDCGHKHRTHEAAEACADKDARACRSLGGGAYSDRVVVEVAREP
jgi:hypothetical protein